MFLLIIWIVLLHERHEFSRQVDNKLILIRLVATRTVLPWLNDFIEILSEILILGLLFCICYNALEVSPTRSTAAGTVSPQWYFGSVLGIQAKPTVAIYPMRHQEAAAASIASFSPPHRRQHRIAVGAFVHDYSQTWSDTGLRSRGQRVEQVRGRQIKISSPPKSMAE